MSATNFITDIPTYNLFPLVKLKMRIKFNYTYENMLLYKNFVHNSQVIIIHIETSHKLMIIKTTTCANSRQYAPNVKAHLN